MSASDRRNDLHPSRSRSRRDALRCPCRRHHHAHPALYQQRHRHVVGRRIGRGATHGETTTQQRQPTGCRPIRQHRGGRGPPRVAAISAVSAVSVDSPCPRPKRRHRAPHRSLIGEPDGDACGAQPIGDRRGQRLSAFDTRRSIHQHRRRRTDGRNHRLRICGRVAPTRDNSGGAPRTRHDDELRGDLDDRRRPIGRPRRGATVRVATQPLSAPPCVPRLAPGRSASPATTSDRRERLCRRRGRRPRT